MVAMMGWSTAEQQEGWRKGPWTPEEDNLLSEHVNLHGEGRWSSVAKYAGLNRSGKSCRLRWVNYLRPGLKRGHITPQEEGIIIELHALWGNKWSTIARYLPGRTDNEIKNFWRTHFKRKEKCTQKQEKRKAQILKAKQQQLQEDQNMNIIVTPHDLEASIQGNNMSTDHEAEASHQGNVDFKTYPTLGEGQGLPVLMNQLSAGSWSDILGEDGLLLSRLWNLDDVHLNGRMDQSTSLSQCNKLAMQNQPIATAALSSGGNSNNITMQNEARGLSWGGGRSHTYHGGYIF